MAKVRGGNTGYAVALVIISCAFVISLLVTIIFYTKIEEAKAGRLAADANLAEYISQAETAQANNFKSPGATVFATTMVKISDLEAEISKANEQKDKLARKATEMEAQYATLDRAKQADESKHQSEIEATTATMEERKVSVEKALRENAALQEQISGMQAQLTKALESADAGARERIEQLTQQIQNLETEKFEALRGQELAIIERDRAIDRLPTPPALNTTAPDAEVASIFGQGNNLFITLGRNDGLVMGMTFEVFDPQPVIRLNSATGEARGKATIEVYGLKKDAATCRVVRRDRGAIINPGDPVVNLGYDPNITVRMYAFGSFDIERDGGTNDIGRIHALIKRSGAELVEVAKTESGAAVLTPDITYVVLGAKPDLPEKPTGDKAFDPVEIALYKAQLAANEAYFSILDEAKKLRVPVLNQDRFLELVGYYER